MRHMSHVRCHMSHWKSQVSSARFFFIKKKLQSGWWRVCYQQDLPHRVFCAFDQPITAHKCIFPVNLRRLPGENWWKLNRFFLLLFFQKRLCFWSNKKSLVLDTVRFATQMKVKFDSQDTHASVLQHNTLFWGVNISRPQTNCAGADQKWCFQLLASLAM